MIYLYIILLFIIYFICMIITYVFTRRWLAIQRNGLLLDRDRELAIGIAIFWPTSVIYMIFKFTVRLVFYTIPEWCFDRIFNK